MKNILGIWEQENKESIYSFSVVYSASLPTPVHSPLTDLLFTFGGSPRTVNGLHLYSAFIQSDVQFMSLIHPFTHTFPAIGCHARYQPARQEQSGVRCLAQGHFDTPRAGSNRQPSDCQTTALPPELYRPRYYLFFFFFK